MALIRRINETDPHAESGLPTRQGCGMCAVLDNVLSEAHCQRAGYPLFAVQMQGV
jgi:hypothetical protein